MLVWVRALAFHSYYPFSFHFFALSLLRFQNPPCPPSIAHLSVSSRVRAPGAFCRFCHYLSLRYACRYPCYSSFFWFSAPRFRLQAPPRPPPSVPFVLFCRLVFVFHVVRLCRSCRSRLRLCFHPRRSPRYLRHHACRSCSFYSDLLSYYGKCHPFHPSLTPHQFLHPNHLACQHSPLDVARFWVSLPMLVRVRALPFHSPSHLLVCHDHVRDCDRQNSF